MGKDCQITGENGSRELAKFLAANGQVILPMVELIEECSRWGAICTRAPDGTPASEMQSKRG